MKEFPFVVGCGVDCDIPLLKFFLGGLSMAAFFGYAQVCMLQSFNPEISEVT